MSTLRYRPVPTQEPDQSAWQRDEPLPPPKAPKQAIFLALVLLVGGLCTLAYGFLHLAGHVITKDGAGWGFTVLGLLMTIPGAYVTSIAALTFCGCEGYSYSHIPY